MQRNTCWNLLHTGSLPGTGGPEAAPKPGFPEQQRPLWVSRWEGQEEPGGSKSSLCLPATAALKLLGPVPALCFSTGLGTPN